MNRQSVAIGRRPWNDSSERRDGHLTYGRTPADRKYDFWEDLKKRRSPEERQRLLLERLKELRANPPRGYPQ